MEVLKWLQKRDYMLEFMKNALESLRDRARKCVNRVLKALQRLPLSENLPEPPKSPPNPPKKVKKHVRKEKPRSNRRVSRRNSR
jgi:hypothetical protein